MDHCRMYMVCHNCWNSYRFAMFQICILSILAFWKMSDGTLWEGQIALYFRWTCLPDCAVPELDADYRRNNRRLS